MAISRILHWSCEPNRMLESTRFMMECLIKPASPIPISETLHEVRKAAQELECFKHSPESWNLTCLRLWRCIYPSSHLVLLVVRCGLGESVALIASKVEEEVHRKHGVEWCCVLDRGYLFCGELYP